MLFLTLLLAAIFVWAGFRMIRSGIGEDAERRKSIGQRAAEQRAAKEAHALRQAEARRRSSEEEARARREKRRPIELSPANSEPLPDVPSRVFEPLAASSPTGSASHKPFSRYLAYECSTCQRGTRQQPNPDGTLRPAPICECGRTMQLTADSASCSHSNQLAFSTGKVKCRDCGLTLVKRRSNR